MDIRLEKLQKNVTAILSHCFEYVGDVGSRRPALVVYDAQTPLSRMLTEAYRAALPDALFLDFDEVGGGPIRAAYEQMIAGDLVVMIQSTNFRLDEFRIRIELFKRSLKVIEHVHLIRITPEEEDVYIDSLAYDPAYYRVIGAELKKQVEAAKHFVVHGPNGARLEYDTPMEEIKPNLGDYRGMHNVGGTFPIGEVFTEPSDLSKVNGTAVLWGYGGLDFSVRLPKPFMVTIKEGILSAGEDAPEEFKQILEKVSADEQIIVREFGLGLNKAFSKDRIVADITAFERQYGLHFSLGEKHTVYKKEGITAKKARHHVDVFVAIEKIEAGDEVLYENGRFVADPQK